MKVRPAIVAVPVRAAPEFAAAATVTLPLPEPLLPLAIVSQLAFEVAVHAHVGADAVTATVPVLPSAATLAFVGAMLKVHGAGTAAWLTVNVCPAIVTVPLRAAPVFAAIAIATVPLPEPLPPLAIVSHAAFVLAVHAHDAVTATDVVPASALTFTVVGRMLNVHAGVAAA